MANLLDRLKNIFQKDNATNSGTGNTTSAATGNSMNGVTSYNTGKKISNWNDGFSSQEELQQQYNYARQSGLNREQALSSLKNGTRYNVVQPVQNQTQTSAVKPVNGVSSYETGKKINNWDEAFSSQEELQSQYDMARKAGLTRDQALTALRNGTRWRVEEPSRLYDNKDNDQTLMERIRSGIADSSLGNALADRRLQRLTQRYGDKVFDDDFLGQFRANYATGKLSQEYALAYSDYMDNPTRENYEYAQAVRDLYERVLSNNQAALDDQGVQAGWLSKDIAGYLPQLWNQTKTSIPYVLPGVIAGAKSGAAAGAATGGLVGEVLTPIPVLDGLLGSGAGAIVGGIAGALKNPLTGVGTAVGSGVYSYDTMRGMAFAQLADLGVDEEQAKTAANDEAFISSVIEMGDTAWDYFTMIPGISNIIKKGGQEAAKTLAGQLKDYLLNIGQEYGEEFSQEIISMANQRRVERGEYDSGITGLLKECLSLAKEMVQGNASEELSQAREAGRGGAIIGAVMGAGRTGVNLATTKVTQNQISQNLNKVLEDGALKEVNDKDLTFLKDLADNKGTANPAASEAIQRELNRRDYARQMEESRTAAGTEVVEELKKINKGSLATMSDRTLEQTRQMVEEYATEENGLYSVLELVEDEQDNRLDMEAGQERQAERDRLYQQSVSEEGPSREVSMRSYLGQIIRQQQEATTKQEQGQETHLRSELEQFIPATQERQDITAKENEATAKTLMRKFLRKVKNTTSAVKQATRDRNAQQARELYTQMEELGFKPEREVDDYLSAYNTAVQEQATESQERITHLTQMLDSIEDADEQTRAIIQNQIEQEKENLQQIPEAQIREEIKAAVESYGTEILNDVEVNPIESTQPVSKVEATVYTIGYSAFPDIRSFVDVLKQMGVNYVVDVRSTPYSRAFPQYNREKLAAALKANGISYVSYANTFGARQTNADFYNDEGYMDFGIYTKSDSFGQGVTDLASLIEEGGKPVLMCSETSPMDCHRAIMVGRALQGNGYDVEHIVSKNRGASYYVAPNSELDKKLLDLYFPKRTFEANSDEYKQAVEDAYRQHNSKIGYRPGKNSDIAKSIADRKTKQEVTDGREESTGEQRTGSGISVSTGSNKGDSRSSGQDERRRLDAVWGRGTGEAESGGRSGAGETQANSEEPLRGAKVGEIVSTEAGGTFDGKTVLETRALPELGINDGVIEVVRDGSVIHAEINTEKLSGSTAPDDGGSRVSMLGTTRPLYGQERIDLISAHPELGFVFRFLDALTGNRAVVCVADNEIDLLNNGKRVLGVLHKAKDGTDSKSIVTSLEGIPHEASHWIRDTLESWLENLGKYYTLDLTNKSFVPENASKLLDDYLRAYYTEQTNGDADKIADEALAHIIEGTQLKWVVKADSNDEFAGYLRSKYEAKDGYDGKFFVLRKSFAPHARDIINSVDFYEYAELVAIRIGEGVTAEDIVQAYNYMLDYNISQHKDQKLDGKTTGTIRLVTQEELQNEGIKLEDVEKVAKLREESRKEKQASSNSVIPGSDDQIISQNDEVEQKPSSRPTDKELNELYGKRMREQEEQAPPHTDEDIPHSDTEFDDGRPVPQKAPKETKPWDAHRHADEYAKDREVTEPTAADERKARRRKLRDEYGVGKTYEDVVYGAKRAAKQKFYFEDSYENLSEVPRDEREAVESLRNALEAVSNGTMTMGDFAEYYRKMQNDRVLKEFYSERVERYMEEVRDAYELRNSGADPGKNASYMNASANAMRALEAELSHKNNAMRSLRQLAAESVKQSSKRKVRAKAIQSLINSYTAWQISPGNVFRGIDGFDRNANGVGYQIQKEIDKATATNQKVIAKAQTEFSKLADMDGYQEFASNESKAKIKLAGREITEQEAVHLIKLIRTLDATGMRDSRSATFDGFARQLENGEYEFINRQDILDDIKADGDTKTKLNILAKDMVESLSDVAKAYLDISDEVLHELGQTNFEIEERLNGVAPRTYDKGKYIPLAYKSEKDNPGSNDANVDPDKIDFSWKHSRERTTGGFVVLKPVSLAVDNYINQSANHIAYSELGRKLEMMNGETRTTKNLTDIAASSMGEAYGKWMQNYVRDINQFYKGNSTDDLNALLGKARRKLQTGALLFSVSVPIKQISSYWSAMGVLNPEAVTQAYRLKFVRQKGEGKDNLILRYRSTGNIDPTVSDVLKSDFLQKMMNKSPLLKKMGNAISTMDVRTVDNLYTATILDTKMANPNMDINSAEFHNLVEEKFEEVVLNTQPIYTENARPQYARTQNELVKIMSMFRTQQTQNFNRLITAIGEWQASKGKATELKNKIVMQQTIKGQAMAAMSLSLLTIAADMVLHRLKKYKDDDGDLDMEKIFDRFAMNAVEVASGTAWFGDSLAKWLIDKVSGGETSEFQGISLGPITTVQNVLERIGYFVESPTISNGRYVATYMAQAFGIPLNNAWNLLNSAVVYTMDAAGVNKSEYDDVLKMIDAEKVSANWKSDNANAKVLLNQYLKGQSRKEEKTYEMLSAEKGLSALKSAARQAYVDGRMDDQQASSFLEKYVFPIEEDADKSELEKLLLQWQMKKDTGISYDDLGEAYLKRQITRSQAIEYQMEYGGKTEEEAEEYIAKQEFKKQYGVSYNDMKSLYRSGGISKEEAVQWRIMCGSSKQSAQEWADAQDVYMKTGYEYTSSGSTSYMDAYATKEHVGTNTFYEKYGDQFKNPADFGEVFNALNEASSNDYPALYTTYRGQTSELSNKQRGVIYLLNGFIRDGVLTKDLASKIWSEYYGYSTFPTGAYRYVGDMNVVP